MIFVRTVAAVPISGQGRFDVAAAGQAPAARGKLNIPLERLTAILTATRMERMRKMNDLVIRNGLVADGSGNEPFHADIAVAEGMITAIGHDLPAGREEVDGEGHLVTPGFVDIHTHCPCMG